MKRLLSFNLFESKSSFSKSEISDIIRDSAVMIEDDSESFDIKFDYITPQFFYLNTLDMMSKCRYDRVINSVLKKKEEIENFSEHETYPIYGIKVEFINYNKGDVINKLVRSMCVNLNLKGLYLFSSEIRRQGGPHSYRVILQLSNKETIDRLYQGGVELVNKTNLENLKVSNDFL